ncbi:hypothetical protein DTO271D3_8388 [Paecilomyces variotii]|nr:hypothetical protein DTO169E5_3507 [Paecilomyces variotii]KAJ9311318.1 hypothetical protein DTO271D3_8388 [Paecilomyces variotii]
MSVDVLGLYGLLYEYGLSCLEICNMDAIGIISGIMQIVTNVYSVSKGLYEFIEGIKNAPRHVLAIAQDVRGLYLVLGSLQGLLACLHQDSLPSNVLPMLESLQQPLDHCLFAFRQLQQKVGKYTKPASDGQVRMRKWTAFRWQFTEKEADVWREHLISYKLTLDVAIATANLANTSQNLYVTQTIEQQMQAMRVQIDKMRQDNSASDTVRSVEPETGFQITNRLFALNRFLEETETAFSGSPPPSPSLSPDTSLVIEEKMAILPSKQNTTDSSLYGELVMRKTLEGHTGWVWDVALSQESAILASVSNDMTTRLWDITTGSISRKLEGHSDSVRAVAFSPEGKLVASASDDMTVRLWDTTKNSCKIFEGHSDWVRAVAFSPDGKLVVSASKDTTIRFWDVSTGSTCRIIESDSGWVRALAFSPDGKLLVSASDDMTVRLWDASTGTICRILEGHSDRVRAVVFSPDGKLVASASKDMTIRLWNVATGSTYRILEGHSGWVRTVIFSPDGNTIASSSDDMTVRLWDVTMGSICRIVKGHSGWSDYGK